MAKGDNIYKNMSGYNDPTARRAIQKVDRNYSRDDKQRLDDLLQALRLTANLAGFEIEERIVLRDMKTGRVWR